MRWKKEGPERRGDFQDFISGEFFKKKLDYCQTLGEKASQVITINSFKKGGV